jgi:hypothetical protein
MDDHRHAKPTRASDRRQERVFLGRSGLPNDQSCLTSFSRKGNYDDDERRFEFLRFTET